MSGGYGLRTEYSVSYHYPGSVRGDSVDDDEDEGWTGNEDGWVWWKLGDVENGGSIGIDRE